MKNKIHTMRSLRKAKGQNLQMLTCYDYQTAQLLDQTALDMILVGDSLGNVILGRETTVEVTLDEMILFAQAVRKGAPNKFLVADMPFGTYADFETGLKNGLKLFQQTRAQALKLEGGSAYLYPLIERLTQNGVPVMGHLGLRPQSVHQMGGYYTHGKNEQEAQMILQEARGLEQAGCFAIVLECVESELATEVTKALNIPVIGIGSGQNVDGQVLVINDLLQLGPKAPPKFCQPIAQLFELKKELINDYLAQNSSIQPKQRPQL